jgi:hypothetical protein
MQWEGVRVGPHAFRIDAQDSVEQQVGRNYHPGTKNREHRALNISVHQLLYSVVGIELVYLSPYDSLLSH